ncbi:MAG: N-formylglutamate amidohydrolase [Sulfitobacter sp.]
MNDKSWAPVRFFKTDGMAPIVLICEHASFCFPEDFGDLGIGEDVRASHVAGDIGALDLAFGMARALDAPLVYGGVSRLIYDCNRPFDAPDCIPPKSEIFEIPGNAGLSEAARRQRYDLVSRPFHSGAARMIDTQMAKARGPVAVVTVHSFTPTYHGAPRRVELGFLHDDNAHLSTHFCAQEQARGMYEAALNQPYAAQDGVTHSLRKHAGARGLHTTMIEVRNDLIDTPQSAQAMAVHLAESLRAALADLGQAAGAA